MLRTKIIRHIPEGIVTTVQSAHRNGCSQVEILNKFSNPDDQLAAATLLSLTADPVHSQRHRFCHFVLYAILTMLLLVFVAGITRLQDLVIVIGIIILAFLIKKRNPWGYSGTILLSAWSFVSLLIDVSELSRTAEDVVLAVISFSLIIVLAVTAWYLRKKLFPYMGFLGVKITTSGVPLILEDLMGRDDTQSD
ncbi:MAG: hypothetical protein GTO42_08710 [Candidatus Latescibacteria bacterium]|nr:hypothetical protein [Candidatus Latescibacterota bacterium]NIO29041.1 hypothetical protein [Candidatus Latescibacterota bacterium]NIO56666.1 hypothetical protein [Candidatus Latescibacterota bacterium]NIT02249.1 hypothetical protein [Candidatus Latescibacterota bacterium]NIT39134.1 hypothetical protein [Candidatus Latescibacterota bacterium]